MSLFCDDGFHICHGGIERCREEALVIRDTYEKAGITYSVKKSYWEPRRPGNTRTYRVCIGFYRECD